MIGSPERLGVETPASRSQSSTRAVRSNNRLRSSSPRRSLTSSPASTVASDATGEGPEYRYGGAATLSICLTSVGHAMNASSEEYALEKPPTSTRLS